MVLEKNFKNALALECSRKLETPELFVDLAPKGQCLPAGNQNLASGQDKRSICQRDKNKPHRLADTCVMPIVKRNGQRGLS